jgi:periplasmic divalent cation tolerance protein
MPELTRTIQQLHSYELPEVIAFEVIGGSDAYMSWVRDSTV